MKKIDDKDYEWPSEECRQDHEQLLGWLKELKGLRLENEVILRRLRHLLESNYISQFDQIDPNTKEYIRNIKEADWKVMYLCDQNKSCNVHCKKNHYCKRTSDISHAKNFKLVPNGIYPIIYEEVDEHCIANITFDREQLQKIVEEQVIEPIKNGELVVKAKGRPQGEWVMEDKPFGGFGDSVLAITCSICKESFVYRGTTHNFCPNCGADMRKEAEND